MQSSNDPEEISRNVYYQEVIISIWERNGKLLENIGHCVPVLCLSRNWNESDYFWFIIFDATITLQFQRAIVTSLMLRCKRTNMPPSKDAIRHVLPQDKHVSDIFYGLPVLDH